MADLVKRLGLGTAPSSIVVNIFWFGDADNLNVQREFRERYWISTWSPKADSTNLQIRFDFETCANHLRGWEPTKRGIVNPYQVWWLKSKHTKERTNIKRQWCEATPDPWLNKIMSQAFGCVQCVQIHTYVIHTHTHAHTHFFHVHIHIDIKYMFVFGKLLAGPCVTSFRVLSTSHSSSSRYAQPNINIQIRAQTKKHKNKESVTRIHERHTKKALCNSTLIFRNLVLNEYMYVLTVHVATQHTINVGIRTDYGQSY